MEIHGEPIKFLSEEEKAEKWKRFCYDYTERAEAIHGIGETKVANLMILELMGGKCPKCSTPLDAAR